MDIHYNAFISYRHHPADMKVAEQVHKGLERYRIPKALKKKQDTKLRLFRDKEELPITSNLTDDITRALRNSDFLIVICSTHTKESVWVQREIETFLQTHDHSRILTVIVDGEPYDVIPEILCSQERIDPETGVKYTLPIEPLSCDWRAGKRKAYREELPRLAAALLGCGYDELRQRERQYRTRRLIAVFSAAFAAVVGFSAYVIYNSIQIQKANDQLTEANIAIQANLEQARINQSQFLASASEQQLEGGDRMLAMTLALEALPEENEDWPYVVRAEKALADAVGAYVADDQTAAIGVINCDAYIDYFAATDERDYMFVTDQRNLLTVWDLKSTQQTAALELTGNVSQLLVTPANTVIVFGDSTLTCYDTQLDLLWTATGISDACLSEDRTAVIARGGNQELLFLDASTGTVREHLQLDLQPGEGEYRYLALRQEFYDLSKPLILDYYSYGDPSRLILADPETGAVTELGTIPGEFDIRGTGYDQKGNVLVLAIGDNAAWNGRFNQMMTNSEVDIRVYCFTPEGRQLWMTPLNSYTYTEEWTIYPIPNSDQVFIQVDNLLSVLDISTGQFVSRCQTSGIPIWVQPSEDHALIISEDGSIGSYTYEDSNYDSWRYFKDDLSMGFAGKGVYVKQVYSTQILIYSNVIDENWQILAGEYNAQCYHRAVSGDLVATFYYDGICIFDTKEGKLLRNIPEQEGDRFQLLEFSHEGKYLWISNSGSTLLRVNVQTGQQTTIDLPTTYGESTYFYYSSNSRVCMTEDTIHTLAKDLVSDEVCIISLDIHTLKRELTPVPDVVWDSFTDACELRIAQGSDVYLWFGKTATLYRVDTDSKAVSVYAENQSSIPVLQYLSDGSTYLEALGNQISFYQNDGRLLFRHTLEDKKGVSAYRTSENQLLLLTDSGDILRYSADGKLLGEIETHLYSSFPANVAAADFAPEEIRWIETGDGDLFVGIFMSGNLIHMDAWEQRAWIPECIAYLPELDQFLTCGLDQDLRVDKVGTFPRYSTADIRQRAQTALSGYTLTPEQRAYYGIS